MHFIKKLEEPAGRNVDFKGLTGEPQMEANVLLTLAILAVMQQRPGWTVLECTQKEGLVGAQHGCSAKENAKQSAGKGVA